MRGLVHHVDLTVRDPIRSFPLYDAVLTALGYRLERKNQRGFGWELDTPSGSHSIDIVRASEDGAERRHDRYSPGLHHLAWKVESREEVDRMYQRLMSEGRAGHRSPSSGPRRVRSPRRMACPTPSRSLADSRA